MELFLQGADISATDKNGNSCLHFAAQNEHRIAVEVLLRYGADPSIPNEAGLLPVEVTKNPAVAELFLRDRENIFSPVIQAKRVFAEYLQNSNPHDQQNKSASTAESRVVHNTGIGTVKEEGRVSGKMPIDLTEAFSEMAIAE